MQYVESDMQPRHHGPARAILIDAVPPEAGNGWRPETGAITELPGHSLDEQAAMFAYMLTEGLADGGLYVYSRHGQELTVITTTDERLRFRVWGWV